MNPEFSIIIPAYNNLMLFTKAIDSILQQQDISFEIIVVDDSTNNEIELFLKSFHDLRIKYFHNIPSLGAVKNWNYGLSLATGRYITILHHDECYDNIYSHLLINQKALEKGYEISVSNIIVEDSAGKIRKLKINNATKYIIYNYFPSLLFLINIIGPVSCVAFKKEIIANFDSELCWLVDVEWYYRLLHNRKVFLNRNSIVISSHGHKDQITNTINIKYEHENDIKKINKKYSQSLQIKFLLKFSKFVKQLKSNFLFEHLLWGYEKDK